MNRRAARELVMQLIFELDFRSEQAEELIAHRLSDEGFKEISESKVILSEDSQLPYISRLLKGVYEHLPEINEYIEKYSIGWNFNRISRVSAAILRISMFEILYVSEIPAGSSINEAVELAKKYDTDEAPGFINGVLGAFIRAERAES